GDPVGVVEGDVVEVEIAVNDVRPKPWPAGRDVRVVAVEHGFHEPAARAILDRLGERPELRRLREVPEQLTAWARMEEAAQREVQARMGGGVFSDGRIRELGPAIASMEPLEEAHEVRAVRPFDRGAIRGRTRPRRDDARKRNRETGIDARDVQDRLGLEVEGRRVLPEVRELDDARVRRALDQKCLIALAAEIRRSSLEPEELGPD